MVKPHTESTQLPIFDRRCFMDAVAYIAPVAVLMVISIMARGAMDHAQSKSQAILCFAFGWIGTYVWGAAMGYMLGTHFIFRPFHRWRLRQNRYFIEDWEECIQSAATSPLDMDSYRAFEGFCKTWDIDHRGLRASMQRAFNDVWAAGSEPQ